MVGVILGRMENGERKIGEKMGEGCLVERGRGEGFWWDLGIFSPGPPKSISPIWEEKIWKEKGIEKVPKLSPSLHVNVFFFYFLLFIFFIFNFKRWDFSPYFFNVSF